MPPKPLNDARGWRLKALEAYAIAEHMTDPECRATMLTIGAGYDRMADLIDAREDLVPPEGHQRSN